MADHDDKRTALERLLAEVEALDTAATDPPWELHHEGGRWVIRTDPRRPVADRHYIAAMLHGLDDADHRMIARSRDLLPQLARVLRAVVLQYEDNLEVRNHADICHPAARQNATREILAAAETAAKGDRP